MKKENIKEYQDKYVSFYVPIEQRENLQAKIVEIIGYHISYKDASHLACAIFAGCDYLLTTDDRFAKRYKGTEITILNPLEFIQITEKEDQI